MAECHVTLATLIPALVLFPDVPVENMQLPRGEVTLLNNNTICLEEFTSAESED